jgi:leucyl-tRNA synthetase
MARFLSRFWRLFTDEGKLSSRLADVPQAEWPPAFTQTFHKTIAQVTDDIENLRFNTAISALMILLNEAYTHYAQGDVKIPRELLSTMTLLLSPFAPHLGEEMWEMLGHKNSVAHAPWPGFDASKTVTNEIELAIQVNGKLRDTVRVAKDIQESALRELVMSRESVQKWIEGKEPKKFIYVKGKLVSVVV